VVLAGITRHTVVLAGTSRHNVALADTSIHRFQISGNIVVQIPGNTVRDIVFTSRFSETVYCSSSCQESYVLHAKVTGECGTCKHQLQCECVYEEFQEPLNARASLETSDSLLAGCHAS
jgi:hypothetical protein